MLTLEKRTFTIRLSVKRLYCVSVVSWCMPTTPKSTNIPSYNSLEALMFVKIKVTDRAWVAEWFTALCSPYRWSWVQAPAQNSTNACGHVCKYVDQKGSAAMLTSRQSSGVEPVVNLKITQARKYAKRDPSWLWNPGQTSLEVQTRGISGPTKRTCVLQKTLRKKVTDAHVKAKKHSLQI